MLEPRPLPHEFLSLSLSVQGDMPCMNEHAMVSSFLWCLIRFSVGRETREEKKIHTKNIHPRHERFNLKFIWFTFLSLCSSFVCYFMLGIFTDFPSCVTKKNAHKRAKIVDHEGEQKRQWIKIQISGKIESLLLSRFSPLLHGVLIHLRPSKFHYVRKRVRPTTPEKKIIINNGWKIANVRGFNQHFSLLSTEHATASAARARVNFSSMIPARWKFD